VKADGNQQWLQSKLFHALYDSTADTFFQNSIVRVAPKSAEHTFMERLLSDLRQHPLAWAFLQPVNGEEVTDYYDVIKKPMGKPELIL
jgi:hypothetical protein